MAWKLITTILTFSFIYFSASGSVVQHSGTKTESYAVGDQVEAEYTIAYQGKFEKVLPSMTADSANPVYGKYSCTASKYRNGSYEFIPRGSFTINKSGKYTYLGFEKPSSGTFVVDSKGSLLFKGGYLDGGKAEKTERSNKYLLVFPANPDNRWSCTLVK